MKYQNYLITLAVVAIVASVFASTFSTTNSYTTPHSLNMWTSAVYAEVIRTDGSIEKQYMGPNNVTNVGINWVRDKISATNGTGIANILVLGNGSNPGTAEDVTLITLPGQQNVSTNCGMYPQAGAIAIIGNGNFSVSKLFTLNCTGGNVVINTTALYNQTQDGCTVAGGCLMFAGKNFSAPVTLQNGDQLNVTWYVWAATGG